MPAGARSVAVLGGTGFVGRHVAAAFAAAGYEVLTVARHPPRLPGRFRFAAVDISQSPAALAAFLECARPGVVVDATGSSWGLSEAEMASRCTLLTRRLLDALARMAHRPRLVHLGSALEYGVIPPGTSADSSAPLHPQTAYGRAKLAATRCVLAAVAAGQVDGVVLRIANAVGPGIPETSLLGKVGGCLATATAAAAGAGPAVVELAPLRAYRDYVDVRDVADAVVAAARSGVTGRVIDIGRGRAIPVRALVELLIEVSNVPTRIVERDGQAGGWRGQTSWLQVDIGPARELLGWWPRRSLADAVRDFWTERGGPVRFRTAGSPSD